MFVDVKNAFYSLVRRLVFEFGESDDMFAYLVSRLQLPPDLLRDFLHACRMPPAARIPRLPRLRYLGRLYVAAPDYLLALVELASKHKNGWFHLIMRDIWWLKSVGAAIPKCPEELAGFFRLRLKGGRGSSRALNPLISSIRECLLSPLKCKSNSFGGVLKEESPKSQVVPLLLHCLPQLC